MKRNVRKVRDHLTTSQISRLVDFGEAMKKKGTMSMRAGNAMFAAPEVLTGKYTHQVRIMQLALRSA